MHAHCLWPKTMLMYPGKIAAVAKPHEEHDFIFSFDDGDEIHGTVDMLEQEDDDLIETDQQDQHEELLKKDAENVYSMWCDLKGDPAILLNGSHDVTKWRGVVVNSVRPGVRRVVKINWANENLEGKLPSAIKHLSALRGLYLTNNKLRGKLPRSLGSLTQLTSLGLSSNDFSGDVPSSFANLSKLSLLNLNNNPRLLFEKLKSRMSATAALANVSPKKRTASAALAKVTPNEEKGKKPRLEATAALAKVTPSEKIYLPPEPYAPVIHNFRAFGQHQGVFIEAIEINNGLGAGFDCFWDDGTYSTLSESQFARARARADEGGWKGWGKRGTLRLIREAEETGDGDSRGVTFESS